MNNSITAFLKELRQAFPMLSKKEKQFYKDISNSVWVFAEQNPGCTKEDLFEYFGEPKKIASVYYSNMDSVTFYTKLNKANRVNWMLLACVVFLAAIAILILYLCYTASVAAHKGTAGINIIQASNHNYIILEFTPIKRRKRSVNFFFSSQLSQHFSVLLLSQIPPKSPQMMTQHSLSSKQLDPKYLKSACVSHVTCIVTPDVPP